jgi:carbon monoxide dehydrogenase subunit G
MSAIDVSAEIHIAAEPTDVAAVMFDPQREPEWVAAVKTVDVIDAAIRPGARVRHTSSLFGQEVTWTTEVAAFHFPHQLVLTTADGPFTGTVQYEVGRAGDGSIARVRNVGDMRGLPAALVTGPLRSALQESLARLKALVEAPVAPD